MTVPLSRLKSVVIQRLNLKVKVRLRVEFHIARTRKRLKYGWRGVGKGFPREMWAAKELGP